MGPRKAAEAFLARHPEATSFEVTLYGSLAATGKGHMTDVAIMNAFADHAPVRILWEPKIFLPFHPNGMLFKAMDANGNITEHWTVYSIGGGALAEEGKTLAEGEDIYAMDSLVDIMHWCERTGRSYWEYVQMCEDSSLWDYLSEVWKTMEAAVVRGLDQEGVLPGPLNLRRKAASYYIKALGYKDSLRSRGLVFAYALAVSEENASGGRIVTAPTLSGRSRCGVCHGFGGSYPTVRRQSGTNRVCGGDGAGTSPGHDVRPCLRSGADTLHRAECLRCRPCPGCQHLLHVHRRFAPGVVRQGGRGDETDRA